MRISARAGVVDELLGSAESCGVAAGVFFELLCSVGMEGELGRVVGYDRQVAVPEARELERVVERRCGRPALGAAGTLGELGLAPLVLLLGQVLQLFGELLLDVFPGRGAAPAGAVEHGAPGPLGSPAVERRAGEVLGGVAQLGVVRERPRLLAVAEAQAGRGLRRVRRDALALELLCERVRRGRVEAHGLAATRDRRQHLGRLVREQEQHDVGGRLLERLEQRVGRLVVHRVGALEDEDAMVGLERRVGGGGHDGLADIAAQHLVGARGGDPRQVGVGAVLDAGLGVLGILGVLARAARRRRRGRPRACRSRRGRGGGRRALGSR